jgi:hypothetical protein
MFSIDEIVLDWGDKPIRTRVTCTLIILVFKNSPAMHIEILWSRGFFEQYRTVGRTFLCSLQYCRLESVQFSVCGVGPRICSQLLIFVGFHAGRSGDCADFLRHDLKKFPSASCCSTWRTEAVSCRGTETGTGTSMYCIMLVLVRCGLADGFKIIRFNRNY